MLMISLTILYVSVGCSGKKDMPVASNPVAQFENLSAPQLDEPTHKLEDGLIYEEDISDEENEQESVDQKIISEVAEYESYRLSEEEKVSDELKKEITHTIFAYINNTKDYSYDPLRTDDRIDKLKKMISKDGFYTFYYLNPRTDVIVNHIYTDEIIDNPEDLIMRGMGVRPEYMGPSMGHGFSTSGNDEETFKDTILFMKITKESLDFAYDWTRDNFEELEKMEKDGWIIQQKMTELSIVYSVGNLRVFVFDENRFAVAHGIPITDRWCFNNWVIFEKEDGEYKIKAVIEY